MHPADLDTLLNRELRRLPTPHAPPTLLPRVMAAVEQWAGRPWYTRAWFTWPLVWQLVSLALLALLLGGSAALTTSARAAVGNAASHLTILSAPITPGLTRELASQVHRVDALVNACRILWRALLQPIAVYAFALVTLMCVACAAFGTALNRVAFGRT